MTLIVSLRIPDGIVIAGDSLSTIATTSSITAEIKTKCSSCKQDSIIPANIANTTSTSLSYAQKIFPFMNYTYGIGAFGLAQLMGKTSYFAIRELEQQLLEKPKKQPKSLDQVADCIGEFIQKLLHEQLEKESAGRKKIGIQVDQYTIGFQIVGYEKGIANTVVIEVGKDIKKNIQNGPGICVKGQNEVVRALWSRFQQFPGEKPIFEFFSLQDAITYAEFLIKTTATYQQFSANRPSVGGEIDIALITPFDGFKWIEQKSLQIKLSESSRRN